MVKKLLLDQPCESSCSSMVSESRALPIQEDILTNETRCETPITLSSKVSVGTQTDNCFITSSPIKPTISAPLLTKLSVNDTLQSNSFCESIATTIDNESEYNPSENNSLFEEEKEIDVMRDGKFVVYESMLDSLVKLICCPVCHSRAKTVTKSKMGTSLHCKIYCESKHLITDWKSQPLIGKLPAFNLLISASIFFAGSTYETFRKPVEYAGLGFVNSNTFYNIQRTLIIPSINNQFNKNTETARAEAKTADHVILGDGRFDSPGKTAKYCT